MGRAEGSRFLVPPAPLRLWRIWRRCSVFQSLPPPPPPARGGRQRFVDISFPNPEQFNQASAIPLAYNHRPLRFMFQGITVPGNILAVKACGLPGDFNPSAASEAIGECLLPPRRRTQSCPFPRPTKGLRPCSAQLVARRPPSDAGRTTASISASRSVRSPHRSLSGRGSFVPCSRPSLWPPPRRAAVMHAVQLLAAALFGPPSPAGSERPLTIRRDTGFSLTTVVNTGICG